jgi:hypothetical protein
MFDLLIAGDAVRRQMKDSFGLEAPETRPHVHGGGRTRLSVIRAASVASTNGLVSRVHPGRREAARRRACSEGA